MGHCKFRFLFKLVGEEGKNVHCVIGLINRDNLLIFKFRNFKLDLKDNFVNNLKKTRVPAF